MNDYELIYLYEQGDEEALNELIEKYKSTTYFMIYRFMNLYDSTFEASDLYQISLLTLYRAISTYQKDSPASFQTYYALLFERDLKHQFRKQWSLKSRARLSEVSLNQRVRDTEGIYLIDTIENENINFDPREKWYLEETLDEIKTILSQYPEEEQRIFIAWVEGYTYKEISIYFNISKKSVEYIISKIKKNIKGSIDYTKSL